MARRPKLTQEMVDEAIALKADGLSNSDIICALGIHESTFYRWIGDSKNRLQRALSEGLKKEESAFKRTLLTTIRSAALARHQYWTAAAWLLERKYPDEFGKAERKGDEGREDAYLHDKLVWCDDTPDGKQSMAVWRREAGLRVRPARKSNMRRLSYEWLAGLREICIDPERAPRAYEEFRLKEYDRDGTWPDDIPDGNDHSIDAVRYAMMDDVLRG